ncbi:hypothetical protein ENUP19_0252G0103 [Entamoeba nuttalli]|uniref:Uncharacterized protein n=2 Tax=Entamoeba nuttalli TaxID=412467 RepID=K2GVU1_ENTNP|nr:hypothetical protein ENU1_136760 [Entamoeba nuttalli P19]EKE39228.1 hypothetical protein ENU1_136760 [Entamoeba nuttalli P19]|eukprot:XP_008858425.1 hypothetical protein ENU1_136760 [Entamoeba nuttalli P19]
MSSGSNNSYLNTNNDSELVHVFKIPEIKRMNYPNFSLTITSPNSDIPKVLPISTNIVPLINNGAQHDFNGNTNTESDLKPVSFKSLLPIMISNIQPIKPLFVANSHSKLNSENTSKRRSKDNKSDLGSSETSSEPLKDHDKQCTSKHKKEKSEQKSDSKSTDEDVKCSHEFADLKDDNKMFKDEVINLTQKIFKKQGLILNKEKPKILFESNDKSSLLSAAAIQNSLYNKTNVMFYFMTEQNLYGAYFSKFGSKPNDDKWMDDEKYRIYSIFRNMQFHLQEWKRKEFEDPDDPSKNILHAYGLFTPLNTEKEAIQTYCGIVVNKDRSVQWDDNFDDYYECTESKEPFFNAKDDRKEKVVKLIIVGRA